MPFISTHLLLFFAIVAVVSFLIPVRWRLHWLTLASLYFVAIGSIVYLVQVLPAAQIMFYGVRMGERGFGPAFYVLGSHVAVGALIFYALLTNARARLAP